MVSLRLKEEHTTLADYLCTMLCPLSPRRTVDPISPFGRSLAQSLDSEGLTTLQVEWSDDLVAVCAAGGIDRLALVQFERWKMRFVEHAPESGDERLTSPSAALVSITP